MAYMLGVSLRPVLVGECARKRASGGRGGARRRRRGRHWSRSSSHPHCLSVRLRRPHPLEQSPVAPPQRPYTPSPLVAAPPSHPQRLPFSLTRCPTLCPAALRGRPSRSVHSMGQLLSPESHSLMRPPTSRARRPPSRPSWPSSAGATQTTLSWRQSLSPTLSLSLPCLD